jgi:hypothetical protein
MNVQSVLKCVVACAVGGLLLAGSAAAQFNRQTLVANVEPGPGGQVSAGTSAARCGNTVLVGFGDSDSSFKNSFDGYSVSSNGGKSFRDLGVLPVSSADNFGFGGDGLGFGGNSDFSATGELDLSVACANANILYYSSGFTTSNTPDRCPGFPICAAISVSISKDAGASWTLPIMAATGSIDSHQFRYPSIAADPANPQRVYVGYWEQNSSPLDSDFTFSDCTGNDVVTEIRVASSSDGGATWTPHIVDHVCDRSSDPERNGDLAGPKIAVSPDGKVYLTYEFRPFQGPAPNEIRFARSLDQANTFSTPIIASTDAINNALPHLGVDGSNLGSRGTIYLTWSGSPTGNSTDVLVSDSVDEGVSFSFPRSISAGSQAHFQARSVVTVDNDAQVAACFYETPGNSPSSSSVYSYNCATSFNKAASWTVQRLASSAPIGFDAVAGDFLLQNDGFFTSFELQNGSGQRRVFGQSADR